MNVNKVTLLFTDLDESDVIVLKEISDSIGKGFINWEHPFVAQWFSALNIEANRLIVASTLLHIRILQSIVDYVFQNGWTK